MSKQNGDCHSSDIRPEQITAHALGQLQGDELVAVKTAAGTDARLRIGDEVEEIQSLATAIQSARAAEPLPKPSAELRAAVEQRLAEVAGESPQFPQVELPAAQRWWRPTVVEWLVAGGICVVLAGLMLPAVQSAREASRRTMAEVRLRERLQLQNELENQPEATTATKELYSAPSDSAADEEMTLMVKPRIVADHDEPLNGNMRVPTGDSSDPAEVPGYRVAVPVTETSPAFQNGPPAAETGFGTKLRASLSGDLYGGKPQPTQGVQPGGSGYGGGVPGASPRADGWARGAGLPGQGQASGTGGYNGAGGYPGGAPGLRSGYPGESSGGGKYGNQIASNPVPGTQAEAKHFYQDHIITEAPPLAELRGYKARKDLTKELSEREVAEHGARLSKSEYDLAFRRTESDTRGFAYRNDPVSGEQYESIIENPFRSPLSEPLSTFSIDVDTASYANVRRFLNEGRLPPPSAVRIEELVNYFTYSYPQPSGREPFSVNMETAECPWNAGHLLLRVGLKGKEVHRSERPPSNLTFLLDVSGSMADANKLPLLKTTLMMFVAELTENDRVSIVTYAGEAGLRLPPTRGHEKEKIMAAIDSLSAGGSTHGSAGIQLAYEQAGQYFLKEGTNRVILATDGDLNVGITSDDALVELIKEKAAGGTFLTVLGFGTGNLKDGKLEKLADNGNGVYAYIDGVREGRKVLVEQMSGNLVTIAKDVKIQIEFNPAQIASYRLLGYENRVLAAADFNNDKKDAGEIGAGHTVTALYELVPVGTQEVAVATPAGEPLKYQGAGGQRSEVRSEADVRLTEAAATGELLTLKLRYKEPDGVESRLVEFPLKERGGQFHSASKDLQFAAAVASFGMILRGSEHRGSGNLASVAEIAGSAIGDDPSGYRAEFLDLVRKAQALGAK